MKPILTNFPELFYLIDQCYRHPSLLAYGDVFIDSAEGVQQGDPLGPLLFCLAVMPITKRLSSNLNLWYLDDVLLAGDPDTVLSDLSIVLSLSAEIGLSVNTNKCEVFALSSSDDVSESFYHNFDSIAPGISVMSRDTAVILGTAVFNDGVTFTLEDKVCKLSCLIERLKLLDRHDAFFLLKNCVAIPRLLYVLRTSRCSSHPLLVKYDQILRQGLEFIVNSNIDDTAWLQATLPVSFGGLGLRCATDLAEPSFLASVFSVSNSVRQIVRHESTDTFLFGSLPHPSSTPNLKTSQKAWDTLLCERVQADLLTDATNHPKEKSRLLAATARHSGAWLHALPSSTLGLKLDDEQLRVAVALRIGAPICEPHHCRHCNTTVDAQGTHGLSCRFSIGRFPRHQICNSLLKQALGSAGVPAVLEPHGLSRTDGKRPDGMTLIPWHMGRALVWDFTCVDTLAASNLDVSKVSAGGAADRAFRRKEAKYAVISSDHFFVPVAVETLGAWAEESLLFIRELGRRIARQTGEPRSTTFLLQRLSIAVQKMNSVCILSTLPVADELPGFYNHF